MVKLIIVGVWGALISVITFVALSQSQIFADGSGLEATAPKIVSISTGIMRVPIMADQMPSGYVLLDLDVEYDRQPLADMAGKFQSIAIDEAFRAVYENMSIDYKNAKKTDLSGLLKIIGERLNKRLSSGAVKELRIKEFMFVPPRNAPKRQL